MKMKTLLVKPKSKVKTKKMRLDVLMPLVSGILSYDQEVNGKSPILWKHIFQHFVNNLSLLIGDTSI